MGPAQQRADARHGRLHVDQARDQLHRAGRRNREQSRQHCGERRRAEPYHGDLPLGHEREFCHGQQRRQAEHVSVFERSSVDAEHQRRGHPSGGERDARTEPLGRTRQYCRQRHPAHGKRPAPHPARITIRLRQSDQVRRGHGDHRWKLCVDGQPQHFRRHVATWDRRNRRLAFRQQHHLGRKHQPDLQPIQRPGPRNGFRRHQRVR